MLQLETRHQPTAMKAGDKCTTPHGVGTIIHFEVYAPPKLALHPEPEFWSSCETDPPEGWFVRAGVEGCHPTLDIGYYPLDQISPCKQNETLTDS